MPDSVAVVYELRPYDEPALQLRPLELELVQLLARGRTVEQAAGELNYSVAYLRRILGELRGRLGAANAVQLVGIVVARGLVRAA